MHYFPTFLATGLSKKKFLVTKLPVGGLVAFIIVQSSDLVMETTQYTFSTENSRKDKTHFVLNSREHTISETILLAQLHALCKDSNFISGMPMSTSRIPSGTSHVRVESK